MSKSADIPVIDVSGNEGEVARQLVDAAEEHGFIYIRNVRLDITPNTIDEAFRLVSKLCPSDFNTKGSLSCTEPTILTVSFLVVSQDLRLPS